VVHECMRGVCVHVYERCTVYEGRTVPQHADDHLHDPRLPCHLPLLNEILQCKPRHLSARDDEGAEYDRSEVVPGAWCMVHGEYGAW
jgi:hypothetical protein